MLIGVIAALLAVPPLTAPAAAAPPTPTPTPVIITIAGTGEPGFSGDGGPALRAGLANPSLLAFGPDHTLYFVDGLRIRAITPDGIIRTIAGTGEPGFSGDGGPANTATFSSKDSDGWGIRGLAVSADGTIYLSDTDNNRVRAIDPKTHTIHTIAGSGPTTVSNGRYSGDGGPATAARLNGPAGLALDPHGTLYIADWFNNRIRAITPDGIIRTVAGTANPGDNGAGFYPTPSDPTSLVEPESLAVAGNGTIYVSEPHNQRLATLDPRTGRLTTLRTVPNPTTITIAHNTLYIVGGDQFGFADTTATVYATPLSSTRPATILAGGGPTRDDLGDDQPATTVHLGGRDTDVAVGPDGTVYVSDGLHNRIRAITTTPPAKTPPADLGHIATYPYPDSRFTDPTRLAVTSDGTVYVLDSGTGEVTAINPRNGRRTVVAGTTSPHTGDADKATNTQLLEPSDIAVTPDGHTLYITQPSEIDAVNLHNGTISQWHATDPGEARLAVTADGDVYLASDHTICVQRQATGTCKPVNTHLPDVFATTIAVGPGGTVYLTDGSGTIFVLGADTGQVSILAGDHTHPNLAADGGPATSAGALLVTGIAIAGHTMYLADPADHRIRAIDLTTDIITTVTGTGHYQPPTTTAREPGGGFSGDGGPATQAQLNQPQDVAVGPHGQLYIADTGNHRIRIVGAVAMPHPGTVESIVNQPVVVLLALLVAAVLLIATTILLAHRRRTHRHGG